MSLGKIYAFAGIQSGGKSTAVLDVVSRLKKRSVDAWMQCDIARTTTLPRNEEGGQVTQEAIAHRMSAFLLETAWLHDIVITDRTPFDCVAYNLAVGVDELSKAHQDLISLAENFVYTHVSRVFVVVDGFDLHMDSGRSANQTFYDNSVRAFQKVYREAALNSSETCEIDIISSLKDPKTVDWVFNKILSDMENKI